MPELPEVETVCRALRPHLLGRRVTAVETRTERLRQPLAPLTGEPLPEGPVVDVRRRAKYIVVEFAGARVLLLHLGMTGCCRVVPGDTPPGPHEHVLWQLDDGQSWRFDDTRRFGLVQLLPIAEPGAEPACLAGLGPEPLGGAFTAEYLRERCRGRSRPVKTVLMDAAVVAGVGNIYASEACFRAAIRPRTAARRLYLPACARLVGAVREVLREAVDMGGTTIFDFQGVDGSEGRFRTRLDVYGREGEPCHRCGGGPVKRVVLSGRSTYYCPDCQR